MTNLEDGSIGLGREFGCLGVGLGIAVPQGFNRDAVPFSKGDTLIQRAELFFGKLRAALFCPRRAERTRRHSSRSAGIGTLAVA